MANARFYQERWESPGGRAAVRELSAVYGRTCYLRTPRGGAEGSHHGFELRFCALDADERDAIVALLRRAGVEPGKPFEKGPSWRIPVYGAEPVDLLARALRKRADSLRARSSSGRSRERRGPAV